MSQADKVPPSTITYTKSEKVTIELTEADVKNAVKVYLSSRLDLPENAQFDFQVSSWEIFEGLKITWDEGPEIVTEEIE